MAQEGPAQLMKWEETTGRGSVATNTEGNATINKGNLPKHIFTLTLLLYRMHIKPRWTTLPTTMYIPHWRWTMYIPLWRWRHNDVHSPLTMNNVHSSLTMKTNETIDIDIGTCHPKSHSLTIGSFSPKLIMCIHHERWGRNFLNH